MITLITGAPGTGKSAALVSMLLEIVKGRAVYVNGIPDLQVPHLPLANPDKWHEEVPDGSIVVIDEVQRVWRPAGPGQRVSADIAALETHRHRGIDFYIITQGPNLVHSNVRSLVGRHVHLRDLGLLGRWWYEWPETCDSCRTGWKNAPIKKRYRLPKKVFGLYKSASEHIKPIRSVPWMLAVMVGALIAVGVLSWLAVSKIQSRLQPAVPSVLEKPKSMDDMIRSRQEPAAPAPKLLAIDDRVDWVPRSSSRPESAPAFDDLRKVAVMPVIVAGVCNAQRCECYTQQGTRAGIASHECREWLDNPPFNPYQQVQQQAAAAPGQPSAAPVESDRGERVVVMGDGSGYGVLGVRTGAQR
ncbi:MAG: zonular occludens toxin domain-containing protein [Burkholderiaceae bacterium]